MTNTCVGDNDHGDSKPTLQNILDEVYAKHDVECSLAVNCIKTLREDLKASLEAHDEMRLEIAQLTKERDEARRMYCEVDNCTAWEALIISGDKGWDCYKALYTNCYKKEETQ